MTCFILYSQVMVYLIFKDPVTINMLTTQCHYSSVAYLVIIIAGTFYGIWNLNILKYVAPRLCISHKLSIINPRRMRAGGRVTVVCLCVCLSVITLAASYLVYTLKTRRL